MVRQELQNEALLNETLAIWAGFKKSWGVGSGQVVWSDSPEGHWLVPSPPNFISSVDLIVEYLAPKLAHWSITWEGARYIATAGTKIGELEYGFADTPAHALCLAIEKLIK